MHPPAVFSYQQALGAIGQYLDRRGCSDLLLCSLEDGYVARVQRGPGPPEAITFPLDDIAALIRAPHIGQVPAPLALREGGAASPILRTLGGYATFLGALGAECDQLGAASVLVLELRDAVLLSYQRAPSGFATSQTVTHEYLYDAEGLRRLVTTADHAGRP